LPARLQVICCSAARSTITADLSRVEEKGVANLAAAFQDAQNAAARQQGRLSAAAKREVVDFADADYHEAWDITAVGVPAQGEQLCARWLALEPVASRFAPAWPSVVGSSVAPLPVCTRIFSFLASPPTFSLHPHSSTTRLSGLPTCRGEWGQQDEGAAARGRAHARA
jgi:hypothetical protein